jgi:glycosyltransferase involved in cell wall biosynthesis
MHIALVTHRFVRGDGQGRVNLEIAQAALRRAWKVTLIASEVAPELLGHSDVAWIRVDTKAWPTELIRNQVFALKATVWLHRLRRKLDLVHINGFVTWSAADVNSSHFVHGAWARSPFHTWRLRRDLYGAYQLLYSRLGEMLELWSYQRARTVVAVSQQVRRELIESGVADTRVRVIPNGVDIEEFKPCSRSRADLGLPEGPLVLFVGDIKTPRKNLDTVLRALTHVDQATLLIVGDDSGSPYPRLARELGLLSRTRFLGFRRDIAALMQASDLFVFPSRYEPSGLVLFEAAASGLPIIASGSAGGTEVLGEEGCVLLDDPEDDAALADAMRRLLASPSELQRLRLAARRAAVAHTWQTMAQRYLDLYCELLTNQDGLDNAGARQPRGLESRLPR